MHAQHRNDRKSASPTILTRNAEMEDTIRSGYGRRLRRCGCSWTGPILRTPLYRWVRHRPYADGSLREDNIQTRAQLYCWCEFNARAHMYSLTGDKHVQAV